MDLENIVYYRGDTHYFVMTALKNCLLERGVIKEDIDDRSALLAPSNIDRAKLHQFAIDASHFATGHFSKKLPVTDFALGSIHRPYEQQIEKWLKIVSKWSDNDHKLSKEC